MITARRLRGGCWILCAPINVIGTLARCSGNRPETLYGMTEAQFQRAPFFLTPAEAATAARALANHRKGIHL